MKTRTVELYKPHDGQLKIHRSKARFRVVACGRRYGKTLLSCNEIAKFALEHKSAVCAWVAPTYRQSKIAYRLVRNALRGVISYKSDSELRVDLRSGSSITFFSSDNYDALRGYGFHAIIMDECADIDERAWTEVLRPTLSDTNGWALMIGTPKGRNFFFRLFVRGRDPEYSDWESFTAPTSDNPFIPEAEIEAAKRDLPEDTYAQEYGATFLEESAGVFRRIESILKGKLDFDYAPEYGHKYILGWDPAKYQDYSVLTLMDVATRKVVWWDRFHHSDYTFQVKKVVQVAKRFNNAFILMDSTGAGDVVFELLRENYDNCDGYVFTNPSKKTLIETLQLAIQDRAFEMPDIPVVVNELRQFEYKISPSRNVIYGAPVGCHDDCVISLALVWYAVQSEMFGAADEAAIHAMIRYAG